jgi:error-prone DNA polymerase
LASTPPSYPRGTSSRERFVRWVAGVSPRYGFPESHSASFALIAYASAYLKVHHPAAFYCALLNNWPMGFYHPATLVKDAERHGVSVWPIDVMHSAWRCTIEAGALRLGLRYVSGLREASARRIEAERAHAPFVTLGDLVVRTGLQEDERRQLANAGACATFGGHRRDVLWQLAALDHDPTRLFSSTSADGGNHRTPSSPLKNRTTTAGGSFAPVLRCRILDKTSEFASGSAPRSGAKSLALATPPVFQRTARCPEGATVAAIPSPLPLMSPLEETLADYASTGLTAGPHVMTHLRERLRQRNVVTSAEIRRVPHGRRVRVAGHVIVRQRPGTAKGMLFLTLEDETGTCNVVIRPEVFRRHRRLLHTCRVLFVEGRMQNVDGVMHIQGASFEEMALAGSAPPSHDFH